MASDTINILLTSFRGLSLPGTLSIPLSASLPISSFTGIIADRLPENADRLTLTTSTRKAVNPSSSAPLSSLLSGQDASILSLRLSACLPGGKGGFGSQLRAAGGRMSSRKSRQRQQQEAQGSSRNLDGRRLRTITEAKKLAEYLALKPDMDKKEKEEKRQRWESIVDAAERREDEIKRGKGARLDGDWVNSKEEAERQTRDAVLAAMKAGLIGKENDRTGSESSASARDEQDSDEPEASGSVSSEGDDEKPAKPEQTRTFFGWDDDEDMSDDEEPDEDGGVALDDSATVAYEGKGKGKAT